VQHLAYVPGAAVQVQVVQVAYYVIDIALVHDHFRELGIYKALPYIQYGGAHIHRLYLVAGYHAVAYLHIHQVQGIFKELRIQFLHLVLMPVHALLHEHLEVHAVKDLVVLADAHIEEVLEYELRYRYEDLGHRVEDVVHQQYGEGEDHQYLLGLAAEYGLGQKLGKNEDDEGGKKRIEQQVHILRIEGVGQAVEYGIGKLGHQQRVDDQQHIDAYKAGADELGGVLHKAGQYAAAEGALLLAQLYIQLVGRNKCDLGAGKEADEQDAAHYIQYQVRKVDLHSSVSKDS